MTEENNEEAKVSVKVEEEEDQVEEKIEQDKKSKKGDESRGSVATALTGDNEKKRRDSRSSIGSRIKSMFMGQKGGSFRAVVASQWVVDLERREEGYIAGRWETIGAMCSGSCFIIASAVFYVMVFCFINGVLEDDTAIGFGDDVFTTLINSGESVTNEDVNEFSNATVITGLTMVLWAFIYIFDVFNWGESVCILGIFGKALIALGIGMLFTTSLLLTNVFPALPFMTYWIFILVTLAGMKTYIFPTVQKLYYLKALQGTLFATSLLVLILYCTSVFGYNQYYGGDVQVTYFEALECPDGLINGSAVRYIDILADPALEDEFLDIGEFSECDEAFLVWAAPGLYFVVGFLLAAVMLFLYRAEKKRIASKEAVGIEPLAQVFLVVMLLSLLGLWVSASIASATAAVGDAILSLSFLALILMLATAVAVFGANYLDSQIKKTSIGLKAYDFFGSNWGKGLLVVAASPPILAFLAVDYIKQRVRMYTCLGKSITDENEKKMKCTKPVATALGKAMEWEWGSVITKAIIWGMVFFTFSVLVSRATIVFLSFLRDFMSDFTLEGASFVLIGVGIVLFLLPPVPGVPVYVTAGVILPTIAERDVGLGLLPAILFGTALSLGLKILALCVQQKIIGECFGSRSVAVRYAIGVNSVEIRATKKVLSEPGFNYKKVAVLCGGPDWPTSVMTGILKLNVFSMICGTLPVVVLIAPCVVIGALLVETSADLENDLLISLYTVSLFLTVVVQSGSMLAAAQVLASAAVYYKDKLDDEPFDEEVRALEEKNKAKIANYCAVTAWKNLSWFWRITHVINLSLMILSCYAFQLFGSTLFITYEITDTIGEVLDGNAFKLVTNEGWFFMVTFFIPVIYYFIFKNIVGRRKATEEELLSI